MEDHEMLVMIRSHEKALQGWASYWKWGSTEDLGRVVKGGSMGLWQVTLGVIYGPLRGVTQRNPLGQIRTEKRVLGRARK